MNGPDASLNGAGPAMTEMSMPKVPEASVSEVKTPEVAVADTVAATLSENGLNAAVKEISSTEIPQKLTQTDAIARIDAAKASRTIEDPSQLTVQDTADRLDAINNARQPIEGLVTPSGQPLSSSETPAPATNEAHSPTTSDEKNPAEPETKEVNPNGTATTTETPEANPTTGDTATPEGATPPSKSPEEMVQEANTEISKSTEDLKALWDSIPDDLKNDPLFDELATTYGGDIQKYIDAKKQWHQTQGNAEYWGLNQIRDDLNQKAALARETIGSEKADTIIAEARGKATEANTPSEKTTTPSPESPKATETTTPVEATVSTVTVEDYQKMIADGSITKEQYQAYREMQSSKILEEKVKNGTATDEEFEKYQKSIEPEDTETRSPEDIKKANEEELYEIGSEFFSNVEEEDVDKIADLAEKFNDKLAAQQGLEVSDASKKELHEFIGKLMKPEKAGSQKETVRMKALKEKLIELSRIEQQLRSIEKQAEQLNDKIDKGQSQTDRDERAYYDEKDPTEKQKKLLIFQRSALQLQGLIDIKDTLKDPWLKADIDRRQVLGYIHRKLGTRGLIGNVLFGAGTAGRDVVFAGKQIKSYTVDRFT